MTVAAIGAAGAIVAGGTIPALAATATTPLTVTLKASAPEASAFWSVGYPGGLVFALGSQSSSIYAEMDINDPPSAVPTSEPTFTTDNYTAGSPRWVIELNNGKSLVGYPAKSGLNGTDMAWGVGNGAPYTDYQTAYTNAGASSTTVKDAFIIADGDQPASTQDTLTDITYDSQTITMPTSSGTATGEIRNAYSGKCLDVRNNYYFDGGLLQQWTCGASYNGIVGADQHFKIVSFSDGTAELQAIDTYHQQVYCVAAASAGAQLTLQSCDGPSQVGASQDMKKVGPYYTFPGTGSPALVMTDWAAGTANGNKVAAWTENPDATNQQWSLP
jgi:ricin-type beta-trefoil lectin protein